MGSNLVVCIFLKAAGEEKKERKRERGKESERERGRGTCCRLTKVGQRLNVEQQMLLLTAPLPPALCQLPSFICAQKSHLLWRCTNSSLWWSCREPTVRVQEKFSLGQTWAKYGL